MPRVVMISPRGGLLLNPWADGAGKGLKSKREWLCLYSPSLDLQLCGNSETK